MKTWRITEEQFKARLLREIKNKIAEYEAGKLHCQKKPGSKSLEKIDELCRKYNRTNIIDNKLEIGVQILCNDVVGVWEGVSTDSTLSTDDIVFWMIVNQMYNCHAVCVTYLCGNDNIVEEAIPDMIYIGSGLFDFDMWNDKNVKIVTDVMRTVNRDISIDQIKRSDSKDLLNLISQVKKKYPDRCLSHLMMILDWCSLPVISYSDEFKEYYKDLVAIRKGRQYNTDPDGEGDEYAY